MSQAFVKENDENGLLSQVDPTIPALVRYIKTENNGMITFVKQTSKINGAQVVTLSNGFSYFLNSDNSWEMVL